MKKKQYSYINPYNSDGLTSIIDRNIETEKMITLIESGKPHAYILFSASGIGKSSIALKLIQKVNVGTHGLPIRVKTAPKNQVNYDDGAFLYAIFYELNRVISSFSSYKQFKRLRFEYYVSHLKDKSIKRRIFENFFDKFYTVDNVKNTFPRILILYIIKRLLRLGEFNYINVLRENSLENQMIIANYIKYVFSSTKIILSVDNLQNIDGASLKHLLDIMNECKRTAPFFLLEYTLQNNSSTEALQKIIEFIKETGINTCYELTGYLSSNDAVNAICRTVNGPISEKFVQEVREYYLAQANGNMRKLIDYQLTYTHLQHSEKQSFDSTLENLLSLNKSEKQIVAFLYLLDGKADTLFLEKLLVPKFAADNGVFNQCLSRMQERKIISIENKVIEIKHASIIDTWEQYRKNDFELYHLIACSNLSITLRQQFDSRSISYYSLGQLLLLLFKVYELYDPSLIYGLVMGLTNKVIDTIDPKELLRSMKLLISITEHNATSDTAVYHRILEICYDYELFSDGLSLINQISEKEKLDEKICLYKFLFLTELDKNQEVVRDVKLLRESSVIPSRVWLILSLLLIINYRKTNSKASCQTIADEIDRHVNKLINYPEYGYYLRLQALFLPRDKGLNVVKESVLFFSQSGNKLQASKSQITYSFYLAITGHLTDAIREITQAEAYLKEAHISRHMFENNKAAISLLLGNWGDDVWTALEHAELSASKPFDLLAIANNKLVWCIENESYERCELLINRINRLFVHVEDKHLHSFINYNLYLLYKGMGNQETAQKYYREADRLKNFCHTLKCRIDHTSTDDHTDFLLTKPWHVCFLTYWCFDLIA